MSEAIKYLRAEIAKRKGTWQGVDFKGNPMQRQQLYTAIVIMPTMAEELLALAELGLEHTPEAVGKRMMEGAGTREVGNTEIGNKENGDGSH